VYDQLDFNYYHLFIKIILKESNLVNLARSLSGGFRVELQLM